VRTENWLLFYPLWDMIARHLYLSIDTDGLECGFDPRTGHILTTKETDMLAFHSDPAVKKKYLARVRAHQKADELVKGQYWENGRGCAVGCTIHGSNHKSYENEMGIPEELAFLEDGIFENLPIEDAKKWPLEFLAAIKPGSDLRRVHNRFLAWLLSEETGILVFEDVTRPAILAVRDLQARAGNGEDVSSAAWSAAWSAAESAARSATRSAAWSAAESARLAAWSAWSAAESAAESAWSAAESARSAAELATRSAAWSAAWSAARSAVYKKMSKKLLELLKAA
jgi:hypothetical protein